MRLIILDTETTGLSPAEGRIVEIAAVEMLDGKLTGREFHHLLNPEHPISEEITEITGINDAMVAGKPIFADIAQAFIDFVGNDKLVVHHAEFDREFLDFEFFNIDLDWPHLSKPELWIDTLAYFKEKHPGERCSIDALCELYGIQEPNRLLKYSPPTLCACHRGRTIETFPRTTRLAIHARSRHLHREPVHDAPSR